MLHLVPSGFGGRKRVSRRRGTGDGVAGRQLPWGSIPRSGGRSTDTRIGSILGLIPITELHFLSSRNNDGHKIPHSILHTLRLLIKLSKIISFF
jgi:hypothetical protein